MMLTLPCFTVGIVFCVFEVRRAAWFAAHTVLSSIVKKFVSHLIVYLLPYFWRASQMQYAFSFVLVLMHLPQSENSTQLFLIIFCIHLTSKGYNGPNSYLLNGITFPAP